MQTYVMRLNVVNASYERLDQIMKISKVFRMLKMLGIFITSLKFDADMNPMMRKFMGG